MVIVWNHTQYNSKFPMLNEQSDANVCQPYTSYFPRADIHEAITPDLLHQLVKGVFKDHLVEWVGKYLGHVHGPAGGVSRR